MLNKSLTVIVPSSVECSNDCGYCFAKNSIAVPVRETLDDRFEYLNRLNYAREEGYNNLIIAGNGIEPLQNKEWLNRFFSAVAAMDKPFRKIEFRTFGTDLDLNYLHSMGVTTLVLMCYDIFNEENNAKLVGNTIPITEIVNATKTFGMDVRLEILLNESYNHKTAEAVINRCKTLGVNQVTFRGLYYNPLVANANDAWLQENGVLKSWYDLLVDYIQMNGVILHTLETGLTQYDMNGISIVLKSLEDDAAINYKETFAILREDIYLYTKWNTLASKIL